MNELAKLNFARKALIEAKTLDEIKAIKDIAIAVKAYTIAKGLGIEMKNEASEIEIRAIREMGKLIKQGQERGEIRKPNEPDNKYVPGENIPNKLPEIGITRKESSISKNLSSLSDTVFEAIINKYVDDKKLLTKTAILREIVKEKVTNKIEIPKGTYRIIYADPPWKYNDKCNDGAIQSGGVEIHYSTMTIKELCEMEMPQTDNDAVLFLWVTSPFLEDSFKVINAWGFKYKASFIWDKIKHNMGHYNSVRHEFLLISTKGSCMPDKNKLYDSVCSLERTEHSEKPEYFRKLIDDLYTYGNRVELFARKKVDNWDSHGNEL